MCHTCFGRSGDVPISPHSLGLPTIRDLQVRKAIYSPDQLASGVAQEAHQNIGREMSVGDQWKRYARLTIPGMYENAFDTEGVLRDCRREGGALPRWVNRNGN